MVEKRIFTLILVLGSYFLPAHAQYDLAAGYFVNLSTQRTTINNGNTIKSGYSLANYYGANYSINLNPKLLAIGIGMTNVRFDNEVYGNVNGSNQAYPEFVTTRNSYLSFPITFTNTPSNRYRYRWSYRNLSKAKFSISYIPSILQKSESTTKGLSLEEGLIEKDRYSSYQHALNLSYLLQTNISNGIIFSMEPYIGVHNSYLKEYNTKIIDGISMGINLRMQFEIKIHFEIKKQVVSSSSTSKKDLLKKQKEIENQLKNKPKK